jgi:hypothetical protein
MAKRVCTDTNQYEMTACPYLPQMKIACTQQPKQADDDQVKRNDIVEQLRHDKNEYAGKQGNQWADAQVDIHLDSSVY